MCRLFSVCLLTLFCVGCMKPLSEQVKKDPNSIIGKKTQDVGEFDPKANREVSDGHIHATDPVTAPLSAYGPTVEKIAGLAVENAINVFNAIEDRYPRDHAEFMTRIIKENNIQLPVLPHKAQYQYDVANHKLVVVSAEGKTMEGDPLPEKPVEVKPAASN